MNLHKLWLNEEQLNYLNTVNIERKERLQLSFKTSKIDIHKKLNQLSKAYTPRSSMTKMNYGIRRELTIDKVD